MRRAAGMARLWAPWRSRFVYQRGAPGCVFCRAVKSRDDKKHHVFRRSRHAFAILNLYPYINGHVMVAPRRHVADVSRCSDDELLDLWHLVGDVRQQLQRVRKPHGFNLGANIGRAAGAGIPGHMHVHLVPRWRGDTNFMTSVSGVRVISDSLDDLYRRLTAARRARRR